MVQLNDENTVYEYLQFQVLTVQLSDCGIPGIQMYNCHIYPDLYWIHYTDKDTDIISLCVLGAIWIKM
jgi:hypothetical protein